MRLTARLFSQQKLLYEGKLANRIIYLKTVSLLSSVGLASSYKYVLATKGFSAALAGVGFAFTPFVISPLIISWFFKRYITKLYYDPAREIYTAHHYGLLLNTKQCSFKQEDVIRSDLTSVLNTFKVGNKPFFLHDEDLVDVESVQLYKRMLGLDNISGTNESSGNFDRKADDFTNDKQHQRYNKKAC